MSAISVYLPQKNKGERESKKKVHSFLSIDLSEDLTQLQSRTHTDTKTQHHNFQSATFMRQKISVSKPQVIPFSHRRCPRGHFVAGWSHHNKITASLRTHVRIESCVRTAASEKWSSGPSSTDAQICGSIRSLFFLLLSRPWLPVQIGRSRTS